jgi:hypothetical protein
LKQLTGITSKQNLRRAIKKLVSTGKIVVVRSDYRTAPTYSIQKQYMKWNRESKLTTVVKNDYQRESKMTTSPVSTIVLKKRKKDTVHFTPPTGEQLKANGHAWIDATSWDNFMAHRKSLGKKGKLSEVAVKLLIKKCEMVKADHVEMINASIESNWTGLFPDKFLKKTAAPSPGRRIKEFKPPA